MDVKHFLLPNNRTIDSGFTDALHNLNNKETNMSDKSIKEQLKALEDKVEKKLGVDLPTIAWIFIAVISADILFNVATKVITGIF